MKKSMLLIIGIIVLIFISLGAISAADTNNTSLSENTSIINDNSGINQNNLSDLDSSDFNGSTIDDAVNNSSIDKKGESSTDNKMIKNTNAITVLNSNNQTILSGSSDPIYVSLDGDDTTADGTETLPFKTLNKALEYALANNKEIIIFKDGVYNISNITISENFKNLLIKAENDGAVSFYNNLNNSNIISTKVVNQKSIENLTIEGINFYNNITNGRAINCSSENLTIMNCSFINFNSTGVGGAIYSTSTNVILNNAKFINNTGTNGAIIYDYNGIFNITDCTFTNSTATTSSLISGKMINVSDSNFTNNKAPYSILTTRLDMNVFNCNFNNNSVNGSYAGCINVNNANAMVNIINSNFTNNINYASSSSTNPASCIQISKGIIFNCKFTNNTAKGGTTIRSKGDNVFVANSVFINCTGKTAGIYSTTNHLNVLNCSFIDLNATRGNYGGAIYSSKNANIYNCSFINIKNPYAGGAIYAEGNITIANNLFSNTTATNGGAIYTKCNNSNIINNTFSNCSAKSTGGAIYSFNSNITNCNFTNCNASSQGGAIYIYSTDKSINVTNCIFNNTAALNGGAIYTNSNLTIRNSKLTNGKTKNKYGFGGSIYSKKNLLIENTTFENNSITLGNISTGYGGNSGGAIYSKGNVTIINSSFINNTAPYRGAAISTLGNLNITNTSFINNSAYHENIDYSDYTSQGGAIYADDGNVSVENSSFINNNASIGGAIYNEDGNVSIENISFTNNNADIGGAIYAKNNYINNSNFKNNSATEYGGAIYVSGGVLDLHNSNFTNNSAFSGGAIITYINDDGDVVDNCNFINNSAKYYGGALSSYNVNVTNSNFTNNTAGSYGAAIFSNLANINNSNFINNTAGNGSSIELLTNGTITNSNISNNNISIYYYNISSACCIPICCNTTHEIFCIEKILLNPSIFSIVTGNFTIENILDGSDVSDYIKILLYDIISNNGFIYQNGIYDLQANSSEIQEIIWIFTNEDYLNSNDTTVQYVIQQYNDGLRVNNTNRLEVPIEDGETSEIKNTTGTLRFEIGATGSNGQNVIIYEFIQDNLDVEKSTIDANVTINDTVRFNITVINNGAAELPNVFINDSDYDHEGLVYIGYENGTGNWTYEGNGIWRLDGNLGAHSSANIIVLFKALNIGTFVNNVTSGVGNKTLSNSSNNTTVTLHPDLKVEKITITPLVYVGNLTSFTIIVTNTGNAILHNVCVNETYIDGLTFKSYSGANWTRNGYTFSYLNDLAPGESASFNVTYGTVRPGNFTNIVYAYSNETNVTNATNVTEVIDNSTSNKTNQTNNKTNKTSTNITNTTNTTKETVKVEPEKYSTGNPLYLLLISLIAISGISIRRKR